MVVLVELAILCALLVFGGSPGYSQEKNENIVVDVVVPIPCDNHEFQAMKVLTAKYDEVVASMEKKNCHPLHPIKYTMTTTEVTATVEFFCKK